MDSTDRNHHWGLIPPTATRLRASGNLVFKAIEVCHPVPGAAVSVFPLLVIVHALAATVWTGGHLVLDLGVLPRALRERSGAQIRAFEEVFEPLGLTALAIKVFTGLWMGWICVPGFRGLLSPANPIGMLVGVKLLLLAATAALAWHIRGITALAIAFVVVGALIRLGGLG